MSRSKIVSSVKRRLRTPLKILEKEMHGELSVKKRTLFWDDNTRLCDLVKTVMSSRQREHNILFTISSFLIFENLENIKFFYMKLGVGVYYNLFAYYPLKRRN